MDVARLSVEISDAVSGTSGIESSGGMNTVEAEPEPEMDERMLRMDGAGDGVRLGIVAPRSIAFLYTHRQCAIAISKYDDIPDCTNPTDTLASTLCAESLDAVCVEQLERTQQVQKINAAFALVALCHGTDGANIVLRAGMRRACDAAHLRAVEQVKCDNAATTRHADPREQELVRIEHRLASSPAIWRRSVNVQVPENADAERL